MEHISHLTSTNVQNAGAVLIEDSLTDVAGSYESKYISSVYWMALCLYHEARGEPIEGQIAVAHVIITRAAKRRKSVEQVIKQKHQFSWYSDGRPDDIKDHDSFVKCLQSTMIAMAQRLQGNTFFGADHYHATSVSPGWARSLTMIRKIGKHVFYRA